MRGKRHVTSNPGSGGKPLKAGNQVASDREACMSVSCVMCPVSCVLCDDTPDSHRRLSAGVSSDPHPCAQAIIYCILVLALRACIVASRSPPAHIGYGLSR